MPPSIPGRWAPASTAGQAYAYSGRYLPRRFQHSSIRSVSFQFGRFQPGFSPLSRHSGSQSGRPGFRRPLPADSISSPPIRAIHQPPRVSGRRIARLLPGAIASAASATVRQRLPHFCHQPGIQAASSALSFVCRIQYCAITPLHSSCRRPLLLRWRRQLHYCLAARHSFINSALRAARHQALSGFALLRRSGPVPLSSIPLRGRTAFPARAARIRRARLPLPAATPFQSIRQFHSIASFVGRRRLHSAAVRVVRRRLPIYFIAAPAVIRFGRDMSPPPPGRL